MLVGIAAAAGMVMGLLSRRWLTVGYCIGVLASVVISKVLNLGPYEWSCMIFALLAGSVAGVSLNQRLSAPTQRRSIPTGVPLLTWDDRDESFEASADPPSVVSAVRALDGRRRTVISVFKDGSRLDIAGDAAGALMVYHCVDRADQRADWYHLTTPEGGDRDVEVTVAGVAGHFSARQTTQLDAALRAVEHYLVTGQRDPELPWRGGPEVADMRPGALQLTD